MPTNKASENLYPLTLVSEVLEQTLRVFLAVYPKGSFLIIRLDDATGELMAGLSSGTNLETAAEDKGSGKANVGVLGFNTVIQSDVGLRGGVKAQLSTNLWRAEEAASLKRRVLSAPHFIQPLRKKSGDSTFAERISVGRARNKDIVLRHSSVSKFHGWFETDQNGTLYVADAGSKNGTYAKGEPVASRKPVRVDPGDEVKFGSIITTVCSAEALWKVVHDEIGS
jgi:hypothetical protein